MAETHQDQQTKNGKKPNEASAWKLGGLGIGGLAKKTWTSFNNDEGLDIAAALGYYFLLALFPMLIFLVSLVSMFSSPQLVNSVMARMSATMPPEAYDLLGKQMLNVMQQSKGGLLTIGAVGTFWAASSGVTSLMDGLNRAYEVHETRSFINRRLIALGMTLGLSALTILGAVMLVGSDQIAALLVKATGIEMLKTVGAIVTTLIGLVFMFAGFEMVFYFGPNVKGQKWSWISPGSLASVLIFLIVSFAFSLYLRFSNSYNATYGSIGGVIILMLWLYNLGLAIVLGGEANSEIAKAARKHGRKDAPQVSREKEPETDPKKAKENEKEDWQSSKGKSGEDHSIDEDRDRSYKPYRRPVGYQPQLAYHHDDSHYSVQAKRRIAMRRIVRNERAVENKTMQPHGWAILKRPLSALVYFGSIGFYLFQAISKNVKLDQLEDAA